MNYLVDTHIFLWVMTSPKKISKKIRDILLDPQATKYVSAVTFWETSLKYQLGKIDLIGILPDKLPTIAKDSGFEILNLDADTASSFYKLPKIKNKDDAKEAMSVCDKISLNRMRIRKAIFNNAPDDKQFTIAELSA